MGLSKRKPNDSECIGYRYYGIPSEADRAFEARTFGCVRYIWNRMLADHNTLYQEIGTVPANTPADYKDLDECRWLNDVDSLALANKQLDLDRAFHAFFRGQTKHPRFHSKKEHRDSYTTNAVYSRKKDGTETCNIRIDEKQGLLWLPKHQAPVMLKLHRPVRTGSRLKSVTITREPDGKPSQERTEETLPHEKGLQKL